VPAGTSSANFITTRALVPTLKQVGNSIEIDDAAPQREVSVALLAIHVVFVLTGHPEFIWATFEHVDGAGHGDLTPLAGALPGNNGLPGGIDGPVSGRDFILYKRDTLASAANALSDDTTLVASFDPAAQSFTKGGTKLRTSIYRWFPASKLQGTTEDEDIVALNGNMVRDFGARPGDERANYRLVGAVWLDKPESSFILNQKFANPTGVGPDDDGAVVVGEDGLSSMAMESFTQDSFVNCFSCHDTRAVKDLNGNVLTPAKKLNVSHILSKFVSETK